MAPIYFLRLNMKDMLFAPNMGETQINPYLAMCPILEEGIAIYRLKLAYNINARWSTELDRNVERVICFQPEKSHLAAFCSFVVKGFE